MKVLILGLGMQGSFLVRDVAESDRVSTVIIGDSDLQRLKNQEKFMRGKVETAMSRTTIYTCSIIAKMLMQGNIKEMGILPLEKAVPIKQFMSELGKRNIYINQTVHKLT